MPAALIKMSVAERERYVRWWIEESGLTLVQLREVAGVIWAGYEALLGPDRRSADVSRPYAARREL